MENSQYFTTLIFFFLQNNWKKHVIFIELLHEMGLFYLPEREITLVKHIILESKLEMCNWSIDIFIDYFFRIIRYFYRRFS